MRYRSLMAILFVAVSSAGWMASSNLHAATASSDGYALEDLKLGSADDLADVCSIEPGHEHYDVAIAFCYGFFEGAIHYDDALADSGAYNDIVCSPPGTTRMQAVTIFVEFMAANPQHGQEAPIDAIFRALIARWPCTQ